MLGSGSRVPARRIRRALFEQGDETPGRRPWADRVPPAGAHAPAVGRVTFEVRGVRPRGLRERRAVDARIAVGEQLELVRVAAADELACDGVGDERWPAAIEPEVVGRRDERRRVNFERFSVGPGFSRRRAGSGAARRGARRSIASSECRGENTGSGHARKCFEHPVHQRLHVVLRAAVGELPQSAHIVTESTRSNHQIHHRHADLLGNRSVAHATI